MSEEKFGSNRILTNDARKDGHQAAETGKFIFAHFFDFWYYCNSFGIVDIP